MKSRNAVIAFAFIPVVLVATWFMFLRSPIPDIDAATAEQLSRFADDWCRRPPGDTVPESEWPLALKRLRPHSVRVSHEGLYIVKGKQFFEERGVFVQAGTSSFQPAPGGDSAYRLIRDSVYWYEIKG